MGAGRNLGPLLLRPLRHGSVPVRNVEPSTDQPDLVPHRLVGNPKGPPDFLVPLALNQQVEDLRVAGGEGHYALPASRSFVRSPPRPSMPARSTSSSITSIAGRSGTPVTPKAR